MMGKAVENVDDEGKQGQYNFQRVRITINTSQPLCKRRKLSLANGKESWVQFKYEQLPNICYWCGRLTHSDRECSLWIRSNGNLKEEDQQFGAWLRAATPYPCCKTVVSEEGFEEDSSMCEGKDDVEDGIAKIGLINQGKENALRPSALQVVVTTRFPPMSGLDATWELTFEEHLW